MTTFVLLAAVLTIAGVALVVVPLLKKQPVEHTPAPWAAMIATGILAIGSLLLYLHWTNWSWQVKSDADSPQTMVARLARKLEKNPDDLNGWLMLGRSYSVLQQYPLALRAYRRANTLAGGQSAEALVGEGEALVLSDENELERGAARLFDRALALDPNNGKALFSVPLPPCAAGRCRWRASASRSSWPSIRRTTSRACCRSRLRRSTNRCPAAERALARGAPRKLQHVGGQRALATLGRLRCWHRAVRQAPAARLMPTQEFESTSRWLRVLRSLPRGPRLCLYSYAIPTDRVRPWP
jgi:tetratricopeptide (TPR) repeat protein